MLETIGVECLILLFDLLIIVMVTGALLDLWFQGSIFDDYRSYFEVRAEGPIEPGSDDGSAPGEQTRWMRLLDRYCPDLLCELLTCRFCLSHHVTFWVSLFVLSPYWRANTLWANLYQVPLLILAAIRITTLLDRNTRDE